HKSLTRRGIQGLQERVRGLFSVDARLRPALTRTARQGGSTTQSSALIVELGRTRIVQRQSGGRVISLTRQSEKSCGHENDRTANQDRNEKTHPVERPAYGYRPEGGAGSRDEPMDAECAPPQMLGRPQLRERLCA